MCFSLHFPRGGITHYQRHNTLTQTLGGKALMCKWSASPVLPTSGSWMVSVSQGILGYDVPMCLWLKSGERFWWTWGGEERGPVARVHTCEWLKRSACSMDTYLFPMSVQSERAPYGLCGWDTQVISIVYMQSPHRLHGLTFTRNAEKLHCRLWERERGFLFFLICVYVSLVLQF